MLHFSYRIRLIFLWRQGSYRPCRPRVPWSFQPLSGAKTSDWSREQEGGKSLIKQIISCRDESGSISEPPPRTFEVSCGSSVSSPSFECLQASDGLWLTLTSPHLSGCSCIWRFSTTFSSFWLTWIRAAAGEFVLLHLINFRIVFSPPRFGSPRFPFLFHFNNILTGQIVARIDILSNSSGFIDFYLWKIITDLRDGCLFNLTITNCNSLNYFFIHVKQTATTVLYSQFGLFYKLCLSVSFSEITDFLHISLTTSTHIQLWPILTIYSWFSFLLITLKGLFDCKSQVTNWA